MAGIFDAVLTIENCSVPKPHPDIYFKTAEKLNVLPNQCVVVEDSETGVEAGKRAGMYVLAVPNKYTKSQDFSKADRVIKNFSKLTNILFENGLAEGSK